MASSGRASSVTSTADAVVLETKLTPPRVRPEHIRRARLLDALDRDDHPRLALVAGPPGFGKSTLLGEWAALHEGDIAWLSLDANDNDAVRFVSHVIAALRRARPGVGDRALAALRVPAADIEGRVLPLLLNDVAAVAGPVRLVIEDYHLITNGAVHPALAFLVERAPSSLEIVLSTRQDPPLPLGRLRARGELLELRADDLRFSDAETASFLARTLGAVDTHDVERLQNRTEGWPAAIYLAALSLRGRSDTGAVIDRFAGDDRYVVDYLTSEILARQTPELRTFLLRTSILDRFCGPLCDEVIGGEDSAARLAEMERSNLLLIALDTHREWFRYHHLFRDLLRHELELVDPRAVADLHRRASAWFRDAGLIVDAANHAIAARDLGALAELVGRHYALFVDAGQIATVLGWLQSIPEQAVAEDWLLGFGGAVVYANAGRIDDAERWLARAESAPQVLRDGQAPGFALPALAGTLRLLRGDIGGTIALERQALVAVPDDAPWALSPRMVLASGLWWGSAPAEAAIVLETATRVARHAGSTVNVIYALGVRAAIALDDEDERAAEALTREAVELLRDSGLAEHAWTSMAQICDGVLAARRGDLGRAEATIRHGLALGERLGAWQVTVSALLALAEVRQRLRDPTDARRQLARARDILDRLPDPGDGIHRVDRTEKALRLRIPVRAASSPPEFWELSPREVEVLRLLPSELSQRELAAELFVSFNTIRTHTRVIFSKLGVTSRAEAVTRARQLGLLAGDHPG
jgi:LuxR family maltose regulon positive regulatory protein